MSNTIVRNVTRSFYRVGHKISKHAPEILATIGAIGVVVAGVKACKATTKVNDILDETSRDIECVHTLMTESDEYTQSKANKDLARIYIHTGVEFVKLYGPSVAMGLGSIACMLSSNHILRKRGIALAAAYTTVDKAFRSYRGNVVERFGEEIDRELKFGIKPTKIIETVVDEVTGEVKEIERTAEVIDPENCFGDGYTKLFDECNSKFWEKDALINRNFVLNQQAYANDMLKLKGRYSLNEALESLGMEPTEMGQVTGWDVNHPNHDGFISFGLEEIDIATRPGVSDFLNGYERSVMLNFNCDGCILGSYMFKR